MKIGVIADTHIPANADRLPAKLLDGLRDTDLIIVAGDLVEPGVLEALKGICPQVRAVWGNMDSPGVRARIPQKEIVTAGAHKIGIIHGWGHPDNLISLVTEEFKNDKVDVIIFGHSHLPVNERRGGILYFNPGSPTDKVFAPYNSYGIIEINDRLEARIVKL